MRQDQIARLQDLAEQVGEVFLEESDPQTWNGAGLPLAGMDKDQRGGRYFDKKNAIQTGTLLARILDLRDRFAGPSHPKTPESVADSEAEIKKFEGQAKELLRAVKSRAARTG